MSLYLGPIHYWLYNKILVQENMVSSLIELNNEKNYVEDLENKINKSCGTIKRGKLEDMINESNIHGWLQEQVDIVENRLSLAIKLIIDSDKSKTDDIMAKIYETGVNIASDMDMDKIKSAEDVYELLNDTLLDGMPCDHVNELISEDKDEVIFARTKCIHEKYYVNNNVDVQIYYEMRNSLVNGILSKTDFVYTQDNTGKYHIKRK